MWRKALLAQHRVAGTSTTLATTLSASPVEVDHYWSLDLNTTSVAGDSSRWALGTT
jgi:hypothetical protein